ncbi:hypothetical protein PPTG_03451 [Phytophthora nicotianae INRA-310]|uniref:Uncharacterized protein n=1 Tax=Phytophthora nicotianae (strain INRA-310) TaxID=761204 RepID=W2R4W4_PHYN3|nr:hypothetical protein PPTG_03451 [Phytophthora nicotianae INRA-310]ETN20452.1 hypothetical protein PPTG_03451 [Phytophthora nicotianae INRA-310]
MTPTSHHETCPSGLSGKSSRLKDGRISAHQGAGRTTDTAISVPAARERVDYFLVTKGCLRFTRTCVLERELFNRSVSIKLVGGDSGSEDEVAVDDASADSADDASDYEFVVIEDVDDSLNNVVEGADDADCSSMESGDDTEKDDLDTGEDIGGWREGPYGSKNVNEPEDTETDIADVMHFATRFLNSYHNEDQVLAEAQCDT